ncbi:MAG: low molecular weight phosphotyrosine protein phosphatase, partial [Gelidibacter sp.]|nr:low molecular weight phosphotyrosine protein phosphatase [Gelidibacter sp.]
LGNICRSPLAEGILKSKVNASKVFVDSAGTGHWHVGDEPDQRSIAVGKKHNIDITNQRGRQFTVKDFEDFDLIYVMDKSNFKNVVKLARNPNDIAKVKLILEEDSTIKLTEVPDPYYGNSKDFEDVFKLLDKVCTTIAQKLKA